MSLICCSSQKYAFSAVQATHRVYSDSDHNGPAGPLNWCVKYCYASDLLHYTGPVQAMHGKPFDLDSHTEVLTLKG